MPRPICLLRLRLGKLLSVLAVCLWSLSVASAQQVTHIDLLAEQVTIPRRAKPLTIVNHIEPLTHSCTHTHTHKQSHWHTHTHTHSQTHTHTHTHQVTDLDLLPLTAESAYDAMPCGKVCVSECE